MAEPAAAATAATTMSFGDRVVMGARARRHQEESQRAWWPCQAWENWLQHAIADQQRKKLPPPPPPSVPPVPPPCFQEPPPTSAVVVVQEVPAPPTSFPRSSLFSFLFPLSPSRERGCDMCNVCVSVSF